MVDKGLGEKMPITKQFHTPKGVIERALTAQEVLEYRVLPTVPYLATVTAIDWAKEKCLKVEVNWMGYSLAFECIATNFYGRGQVRVGETVLIIFMENDYNKAIVLNVFFRPTGSP